MFEESSDRDARNGLFAQIQCTELEGKRHRPLAATYTSRQFSPALGAMAASPSLLDSILGSRLCADWSAVAQYAFGWCVPFLTLGLLYLRWESRPAAQPLRGFAPEDFRHGVILVLLLHIAICLVEEANSDGGFFFGFVKLGWWCSR